MNQLLDVAATPPLDWATKDPDWAIPGQGLEISLRPEDQGRVWGRIQAGSSTLFAGGGAHHGRPMPDQRNVDNTLFHAGHATFLDESGQPTRRAVGSLSLAPDLDAGHSNFLGASTPGEAADALARTGRWSHLSEQVAVYGIATAEPDGGVLFRGAAYPHLSVHEAQAVNGTAYSVEVWSDPNQQGREVFVGAAQCRATAGPLPIPEMLAATLTLAAPVPCATAPISCEVPPPLMAVPTDDEVNALRASIAAMGEQMQRLAEQVTNIEAAWTEESMRATHEAGLGEEAQIEGLAARLAELEAQIEAQRDPEPAADETAPAQTGIQSTMGR